MLLTGPGSLHLNCHGCHPGPAKLHLVELPVSFSDFKRSSVRLDKLCFIKQAASVSSDGPEIILPSLLSAVIK